MLLRFFVPIAREAAPDSCTSNVQLQKKLWKYSEDLVKKFETEDLMDSIDLNESKEEETEQENEGAEELTKPQMQQEEESDLATKQDEPCS